MEDLCKVIKNSIEHQTASGDYALVEVGGSQGIYYSRYEIRYLLLSFITWL